MDTGDVYAGGRTEEVLGSFIAERKLRDMIIVATKAGFAAGLGVHMAAMDQSTCMLHSKAL